LQIHFWIEDPVMTDAKAMSQSILQKAVFEDERVWSVDKRTSVAINISESINGLAYVQTRNRLLNKGRQGASQRADHGHGFAGQAGMPPHDGGHH